MTSADIIIGKESVISKVLEKDEANLNSNRNYLARIGIGRFLEEPFSLFDSLHTEIQAGGYRYSAC